MKAVKNWLKRWWGWLLGILATLAFLAFCFWPLPYYIETPGGAYNINSAVTVADKSASESGSYNFVAVSVSQATGLRLLYAWLTPFSEIETSEAVTGGASSADYERINEYYMKNSQNTAIYQAYKLAGQDVSLVYKGVYVMSVAEDSTFKNVLQIADTVTKINGQSFDSSADLVTYVGQQKLGDAVTVTYERDGEEKTADGKIIKLSNGKNGIGITLVNHTEIEAPYAVSFSTDGVGGPSAGLMFTLAIYDRLQDNALLKGRTVAGTGTIEADGSVGDVGGVALKVKAAADAGASIFFAPNNRVESGQTNYEEAQAAAKELDTDMTIVPVTTAQEAIDYLRDNE